MNVSNISVLNCSGCKVCGDICPKHAIKFEINKKGFWYPKINQNLCIDCGICYNKCPLQLNAQNQEEPLSVYACYNENKQERILSTSGGAFSALAKTILKDNGVIFGCAYTCDFHAKHIMVDNINDLSLLRQSKYYQSDTEGIFRQIEKYLKCGRKVLFVGTPCQNAGLRNFINGKKYNDLYQVDFICRGIISPLVFQNYLHSLEKKYKSKAVSVHFKNKDNGWHKFGTKICFENGEIYYADRYHDTYMVSYLQYNLTMRDSCYNCKFKGIKRCSDLTMADFWGIEHIDNTMDQDLGTSMLMINTEHGKELFHHTKGLKYSIKTIEDVITGNPYMIDAVSMPDNREDFFDLMNKKDYNSAVKKYAAKPLYRKLWEKVGGMVNRIIKKQ